MKLGSRKSCSAFTLVELMMAVGSGSIMLAALITAAVALERSFAAVEGYSISEADQLRVSDYIALDVRRALSASVSGGTLTLTIPNYYNAHNDNPSWTNATPVGLIDDGYGGFTYGTGSTLAGSITIRYYQQGASFIREVAGTPSIIANNVSSFSVTPQDLSSSVSCKITFAPTFTYLPGTGAINATTVYSNTFLRNAAARQ
jgi:hypothetical protein